MNVAIVAPLAAPLLDVQAYGNHVFLCDLARGLQARGHRVTVYAAEGSAVPWVRVETVPVDAAIRRRFLLLRENRGDEARAMQDAFDRLFERLRANRHDVVSQHAFDREAIEACAQLPALHTLHLPPMRDEVVDAIACAPGAVCTVSSACARQWAEASGRSVLAIPNGIPDFEVRAAQPEPLAIVAGRISPEKGVHVALRAAREAGLRTLVAGEVYDQAYYREHVAPELHAAEFLPTLPRARLLERMAAAAVTLMPVEWEEPFGLVAAESQLAGSPVVGYRRGALPELVEDGVTGYLVDPGDRAALVAAIHAARALERSRIRALARERFAMKTCVERYERALAAAAT